LVTMMSNGGPRMALEVQPDFRVLAFACVVSVTACLLFSLAPAMLATRRAVQPALSEARSGRWRLGKGLIVAQAAISLLLLIGAGLFGRTLIHMYNVDTGFQRQGVLMFSVEAAKAGYRGEKLRELRTRILSTLGTVPGVTSASASMLSPVGPGGWDGSVEVEDYQHRPDESTISHFNAVGPRYFATLRARIVLGREFEERDTLPDAKGVAVVHSRVTTSRTGPRSAGGSWRIESGAGSRLWVSLRT
jgi:hypothetical protein